MENANVLLAKIFGAILLVVGLIGFVQDPVLGIFDVNPLHNIAHLLSGIVLLAVGFMDNGRYARVGNQTFGVVYILLALLGFFNILVPSLLDANAADDFLHLFLGVVFLAVGFGVREETRTVARA